MCAAWKDGSANAPIGGTPDAASSGMAIQLSCFLLDDDPIDRRYVSWLLQQMTGFQLDIKSAHTLQEARSICTDERFDLYLLDYWMGEESSVSLLESLNDACKGSSTIVVMSSLDDQAFQEVSMQSGADLFLAKQELSKQTLELMLRNIVQAASKTQSVRDQRLLDAEKIADWTKHLRNMLDSSHGFAALALNALKSGDVETVEHLLSQAIDRMSELRNETSYVQLGMTSRQSAGDLNLRPFDVSTLLAEAVEDCRIEAEQVGKQLSFYEQIADSIILSDDRLLKELLTVLLRGALRYAEEQSDVSVSYELGPEHLEIYISEFGNSEDPEVSNYELDIPSAIQFANLFGSERTGSLLVAESMLHKLRGSWNIGKSGENLEIRCRIPLNQDLLN
ncbi:Response regulator receiver domain-containing protein [Cohaesibacter sp. ES.047]|nr:Response regulator receiver domain-containing protein [Cohaesibacter sp. ES.047]